MAPFALDVRYGPRKFRIACRGPTTVARAKRAVCRRARCDAATLRTAERALDDAEVIESAATLVLVDSRSKLPPARAAQASQHYRVAYALVFVREAPDASATLVFRLANVQSQPRLRVRRARLRATIRLHFEWIEEAPYIGTHLRPQPPALPLSSPSQLSLSALPLCSPSLLSLSALPPLLPLPLPSPLR